ICPNSTNTYSGPSSGVDLYSWSISGNGTISGSTTGSSVTVVAGSLCNNNFILSLIVTLNSCTKTCTQGFTVIDVTSPIIGSAGANATISCPATPTFTAPTATDGCSVATVQLVSDVTTA